MLVPYILLSRPSRRKLLFRSRAPLTEIPPLPLSVCDVPGEEGEYQKGSDLYKADIAEYERRSGFDIQIPAHGKRKHLHAEIGEKQAREQQAVVTGAKRGVGVQLKSFASSYGWPE